MRAAVLKNVEESFRQLIELHCETGSPGGGGEEKWAGREGRTYTKHLFAGISQ